MHFEHDWLDAKPHEQWTRHAYDQTCKCDHQTNNLSESSNSKLTVIRDVTPYTLFEKLRETMMVNMNTKTCTFKWWSLSGIPCKHVMKVLQFNRFDIEKYVRTYYLIKNYVDTYKGAIYLIPTMDLTLEDALGKIKPPPIKRQPGRPRVARIREEDEQPSGKRSTTVRCSLCGGIGQNKLTCQGGTTAKEKGKATSLGGKKIPATCGEKRKVGRTKSSTIPRKSRKKQKQKFMNEAARNSS